MPSIEWCGALCEQTRSNGIPTLPSRIFSVAVGNQAAVTATASTQMRSRQKEKLTGSVIKYVCHHFGRFACLLLLLQRLATSAGSVTHSIGRVPRYHTNTWPYFCVQSASNCTGQTKVNKRANGPEACEPCAQDTRECHTVVLDRVLQYEVRMTRTAVLALGASSHLMQVQ